MLQSLSIFLLAKLAILMDLINLKLRIISLTSMKEANQEPIVATSKLQKNITGYIFCISIEYSLLQIK